MVNEIEEEEYEGDCAGKGAAGGEEKAGAGKESLTGR